MNTVKRIWNSVVSGVHHFFQFSKRIGWWKVVLAAVGALILIVIAIKLLLPGKPLESTVQGPRQVEVRSVSGLSTEQAPLSVVGEVTSQSQAEVRTEGTGEVTRVNVALGAYVRAGQVIAELSNARERASVLQAEGVYDAAIAQLNKVKGGSREEQLAILQTTLITAQESYKGSRTSAVSTLLLAYSTIDDAISRKADQMFSNADTSNPKFTIQTADLSLTSKLENERVLVQQILSREGAKATALSDSDDLVAELTKTESDARTVKNFFDDLVSALNKAVPSQSTSDTVITGYKSDAGASRASVSSLLATLSGTRDSLSAKSAAISIAQKNLEQGVTGGSPNEVAGAAASVKQAQGALAGARATLEKTIVRAPISGTVNSLSLKRGDFVTSFQPAVTIANNGALEIVAYVTDTESKDIVVGSDVTIEGGITGVVTHLAPAVDPLTKKVEVRIGIGDPGNLVNGSAVTITLSRGKTVQNQQASTTMPLIIPISALKVGSDQMYVFSVNTESKLVAHEVTIGSLLGDKVEIATGIDANLEIVIDARGLKEGDTVTLKH